MCQSLNCELQYRLFTIQALTTFAFKHSDIYFISIQRQNPTSLCEKWGFVLPLYALPCLGLEATILNHMFFRTFSLSCQGYYQINTL